MLLACLPWYDLAETHDATDRLWHGIADELQAAGMRDVPRTLDRQADYESQWKSRELLIGQACGYDVYCANDHDLQIVGVPSYGMPGCQGREYRSFVIVRDDSPFQNLEELRGARCVINSPRSHSGMNVLQALVAPLSKQGRFFSEVQHSGAHERSLDLIRLGHADVAAIDCITYGLLKQHRPDALEPTRVVHHTRALTAPPYVTGRATKTELIPVLLAAIQNAVEALSTDDREHLGLLGVHSAQLSDYEGIGDLADEAARHDYDELEQS